MFCHLGSEGGGDRFGDMIHVFCHLGSEGV